MNAMMALQGPQDRRALSGNTWMTRNEAEIDCLAGADTPTICGLTGKFQGKLPRDQPD
jgi:hypothetical protein